MITHSMHQDLATPGSEVQSHRSPATYLRPVSPARCCMKTDDKDTQS